jgi:hypothetical protein
MAINNNSFATNTNIEAGSNELSDFWLNVVQCSIPGISFSPAEVDGRGGRVFTLAADTVEFSDLVLTVLLDKEWNMYDTIFNTFVDMVNVETGQFKQKKFDMWLQIKDGTGKIIKKFNFYGARLMDVGEFDMDVRDGDDSNIEVILTFRFDYMDFNGIHFKKSLE